MTKTNNTNKRGFASMDPEKQRKIAAAGGRASRTGGFASMDPQRQREIASLGGKASQRGKSKNKTE
jgi:general stress protein YciG